MANAAMGTIPTNDDHTCLFAGMSSERFHRERGRGLETLFLETIRRMDRALAETLVSRPGTLRLRAFAGAPSFLREAWGPGWALVGDAGYFKDPLTAHGISDALRDAELLARPIEAGSEPALAGYQAKRDHLSRGLLDVTARVASMRWTLPELGLLHRALSREMGAEVDEILTWDGVQV